MSCGGLWYRRTGRRDEDEGKLPRAHRELSRLAQQKGRAWSRIERGATDPLDSGALGFTLHGLYGILEDYFLRISKFFENDLSSDRWHKAPVDAMHHEIPGVRPALLAAESQYRRTPELQRFGHRFRNLSGEDLDPDKTRAIQQIAVSLVEGFPAIHRDFVAKIRAIADGLP